MSKAYGKLHPCHQSRHRLTPWISLVAKSPFSDRALAPCTDLPLPDFPFWQGAHPATSSCEFRDIPHLVQLPFSAADAVLAMSLVPGVSEPAPERAAVAALRQTPAAPGEGWLTAPVTPPVCRLQTLTGSALPPPALLLDLQKNVLLKKADTKILKLLRSDK